MWFSSAGWETGRQVFDTHIQFQSYSKMVTDMAVKKPLYIIFMVCAWRSYDTSWNISLDLSFFKNLRILTDIVILEIFSIKILQPKFIVKYDGSFFSFYLDWAKCSEQKTRKGKIRFFMHWVDSYVTQSWNDSKYLNILKALLKLLTALKQRTTWFMRHSVFGYGTV